MMNAERGAALVGPNAGGLIATRVIVPRPICRDRIGGAAAAYSGRRSDRGFSRFIERVMDDDHPYLEKRLGHKLYGDVPRLAKIAIWLVLIAVACGLVLYLAVWTNLIE